MRRLSFIILLILALRGTRLSAERIEEPVPEADIVFRVSKELFEDLAQDEIDADVEVDTRLQGAQLSGSSHIKSTVKIRLEPSVGKATFVVGVSGEGRLKMLAKRGPAQIRGTGLIPFAAEKRIHFDGIRFRADETQVTAKTKGTIEAVCSKHGGVMGRVIRKVAERRSRQALPGVEQFTTDQAAAAITETFDEVTIELLDELNETTKIEETLFQLYPEMKSWVFNLDTNNDSLQAAVGPVGAKVPKLPETSELAPSLAQVWIRTTPLEAALIRSLAEWNIAHDLLKEYIPDEDAQALAEDINVTSVDNWVIIQIGVVN